MTSSTTPLSNNELKFLQAITGGNFKQSKFYKERDDDEVTAIANKVRQAGHSVCHIFVEDEIPDHPARWMAFYFMDGDDVWRHFGEGVDVRFPSPPLKILQGSDKKESAPESVARKAPSAKAVIEPQEQVVSYALLAILGRK